MPIRTTSKIAYASIIESLFFAKACQKCAQAGYAAIQRHPNDPRFTRREVQEITLDTSDSIGRRCQDLVAYGVCREISTRRSRSGHENIAFAFTGEKAVKGWRIKPRKPSSTEKLRGLFEEIQVFCSDTTKALALKDQLAKSAVKRLMREFRQQIEQYRP